MEDYEQGYPFTYKILLSYDFSGATTEWTDVGLGEVNLKCP